MSTPISNSSTQINWAPPSTPNGVITNYYIRVEYHNGRQIISDQQINHVHDRQYEFSGLGESLVSSAIIIYTVLKLTTNLCSIITVLL